MSRIMDEEVLRQIRSICVAEANSVVDRIGDWLEAIQPAQARVSLSGPLVTVVARIRGLEQQRDYPTNGLYNPQVIIRSLALRYGASIQAKAEEEISWIEEGF